MFVRELFIAELAIVEILAKMDVAMHSDIVAGGVVLATLCTNVSLLTAWAHGSQHESFLHLGAVGWWVDAIQG